MVGIDCRNKHIIDQKYICCTCSLILREPVQFITCGHRQCQSCFHTKHEAVPQCPHCRIQIPLTQVMVDRGFKSDMQTIAIECTFCHWTGILQDYEAHLDQCHPNPKCEYCNDQFDSVIELNEHKLSQCQQIPIKCLLKEFGCDEVISHGKIEEHYLTQQHQEAAMKVVSRMRSQLIDGRMDVDLLQTTTTTTNPTTIQPSEISEILDILSGGIETLNDDAQRLNNKSLQIQLQLPSLADEISQVRSSIEESGVCIERVKHNEDILNQDLSALKDKIHDMQYVSYDGTFVWKISNVREKIVDAQSERQTSVYSPPFYSSPTGYKMRLRLYLHGDGNARRTHMSLFFVLMGGANDAILKFPFSYKVTFCLFDQTSEGRHIVDSFRPDTKSNSFQRPRSYTNIASGIPKFFPLSMIEQEGNPYVRDNTMFIKVVIDFGDMLETLLPYAMSLNPELPTHVQQIMIKQEADRRAQQESAQNERIDEEIQYN